MGELGEVSKNTYYFEHENEILIIDSGVRFPEENLLGVNYVIPDYNYLMRNDRKRKVLIITHGHEDHISGTPFLLKSVDIEVICTPTFAVALTNEKLEEHRMLRSVKITETGDRSSVKIQHFTRGFLSMTHSIPNSLGTLINTPSGHIAYTGDFKFDPTPVSINSDYQAIAYMGRIGVDLLLSDSTNSGVEDFSVSEKEVVVEILDTTRRTSGRLIVATSASNVYRISQILEAAVACGKKVIIFGRSMENVMTIGRGMGKIKASKQHSFSPGQLGCTPASKTCIVCIGSQGEPLAALSWIADGTHRYIKLIPGDTVVFSSSLIPDSGASVSQTVNKLFRAGINALTKSILSNSHTAGHTSQEEQKLTLQLIKPKYFMPVHDEYRMLVQHKETGGEIRPADDHTFICINGDILILCNHQVFESSQQVQTDDIYVDGNDASGASAVVLKGQTILADNGLVAAVIAIDSKENEALCKPVIVSRGFVFIKDSQGLLREVEQIVYVVLNEKMKERTAFFELRSCMRSVLEPSLYSKTHRNPIAIPVTTNSKMAMAAMARVRAARTTKRPAKKREPQSTQS